MVVTCCVVEVIVGDKSDEKKGNQLRLGATTCRQMYRVAKICLADGISRRETDKVGEDVARLTRDDNWTYQDIGPREKEPVELILKEKLPKWRLDGQAWNSMTKNLR